MKGDEQLALSILRKMRDGIVTMGKDSSGNRINSALIDVSWTDLDLDEMDLLIRLRDEE